MDFTRQCREYNNDKYYRSFYFSNDTSCFRKFPVRAPRANPFLIPTATALNSSRCEFQERGESLPFYLHEILLRRESTRRSRAAALATRRKDIPRASPRGADRTCTESTLFSPLESRGGKFLVSRANFGKHRR